MPKQRESEDADRLKWGPRGSDLSPVRAHFVGLWVSWTGPELPPWTFGVGRDDPLVAGPGAAAVGSAEDRILDQ